MLKVKVYCNLCFKCADEVCTCYDNCVNWLQIACCFIKQAKFFKVNFETDFNEEAVSDCRIEEHAEAEVLKQSTNCERAVCVG